ncbi:bromodomain-containing protein 4-like [Cotesia glomerata]|uniref:bromodomain-containing protein 4-like n=1 Tax=Cotesia glomerata TaxID=32391 RepID=UPI001D01C788|nr:bromodomain-containing protein 4-like [Cotesia glomerata]
MADIRAARLHDEEVRKSPRGNARQAPNAPLLQNQEGNPPPLPGELLLPPLPQEQAPQGEGGYVPMVQGQVPLLQGQGGNPSQQQRQAPLPQGQGDHPPQPQGLAPLEQGQDGNPPPLLHGLPPPPPMLQGQAPLPQGPALPPPMLAQQRKPPLPQGQGDHPPQPQRQAPLLQSEEGDPPQPHEQAPNASLSQKPPVGQVSKNLRVSQSNCPSNGFQGLNLSNRSIKTLRLFNKYMSETLKMKTVTQNQRQTEEICKSQKTVEKSQQVITSSNSSNESKREGEPSPHLSLTQYVPPYSNHPQYYPAYPNYSITSVPQYHMAPVPQFPMPLAPQFPFPPVSPFSMPPAPQYLISQLPQYPSMPYNSPYGFPPHYYPPRYF